MSAFVMRPLRADTPLPLLVDAGDSGPSLVQALPEIRPIVDRHLHDVGGVLFRGFGVEGIDAFRAFAAGFGHELLTYEFGSTPRSQLGGGIYSSTEYPAHQRIPLHNEQAYTRDWPMKIWFHCAVAAEDGGETPIADSRAILSAMPSDIRDLFVSRGLMYVRNYGNGLDVPWPQVFGTDDPAAVDAYCRAHGIVCEWKEDGALRTRQRCQAVARHPVTGALVWFNQAHLFHVSGLQPEVRDALLDVVDEVDLPRNVYFGDGTPIADDLLDVVRAVLDAHMIMFPWQVGDVMMLDNMLTAHARSPFRGPRKVVVAMAEAHGLR